MADSFNNPPQPTSQSFSTSKGLPHASSLNNGDNSNVPRPKRIACVVCRRRKLRCDGKRPSCGTCSRLGHECAYDEARRKSGPKRGYVKELEARLAQVETLLKGSDQSAAQTSPPHSHEDDFDAPVSLSIDAPGLPELPPLTNGMGDTIQPLPGATGQRQMNGTYQAAPGAGAWNDFEWDIISLGVEEPLPTQDVIDELDQCYFEKLYPAHPIIHPPRYFATMKFAPHARPPVALRYIMWALAAAVSDKYENLHRHFYQRARKYAEMEEMKDLGEHVVNVSYCQAWLLIVMYEYKMICLPRAWLSAGKAIRLALMLGLNRLDGMGADVKITVSPSRDWTEKEERRRVFWMAFCVDRYASSGTGWPMMIDERDIMTNLPAAEESFIKSKPQQTLRLADIVSGEGISTLSPFGSTVLLTSFFGRELLHLHRPDPQDNAYDLNGEFWKRHRAYDNLLLHSALSAPSHLRLPAGIGDPNVIFWNMGVHAATICHHQAAILKAEKNNLPNSVIVESKRRVLVAADQTSSIMRMISHTDLSMLNPFTSFCVYVAGRVFVHHLKARPDDSAVRSSLEFNLSALNALKAKNPLTDYFLSQLEVDVDGLGLQGARAKTDVSPLRHFKDSFCNDIDYPSALGADYRTRSPSLGKDQTQDSAPTDCPGIGHSLGVSSLPSRNKGVTTQQQNPTASSTGIDMQGFTNSPNNYSPDLETTGQRVTEMDFSSDFSVSERINPSSGHPTPSTMNSSTNTSYFSKGDQPSPQKFQQQSFLNNRGQAPALGNPCQIDTLMENVASNHVGDVNALASQPFPANPEGPLISAAPDAPFPMSTSWNLPDAQTSTAPNAGTTAGGEGSFDETQWAQLLAGANWGTWPQGS